MESIREGAAGDTIVSFYPTASYLARPSFLELQMAESLLNNFRSAFLFAISSDRREFVKRVLDGITYLLEVRQACNVSSPGTVGENFIGLKRVMGNGMRSKLWIIRVCTLLESVLLPFLFEYSRSKACDQIQTRYKTLKAILGVFYITGFVSSPSPVQLLTGVRTVRNTQLPSPSNAWSFNRVANAAVWGLVYSIQLAQWYFSHEESMRDKKKLLIINPPEIKKSGLPADPRLCPVCLNKRVNPTVLLTSGKVYCYQCAWALLDDSQDKPKFIRRLAYV